MRVDELDFHALARKFRSFAGSPIRTVSSVGTTCAGINMPARAPKAVLERWGHKVEIASDGAESIEMVEKRHFDLVLMDVQMPVLDGVTATRAIRASGHVNARVPIIAMTANVMPQQIAALIDAGMDDHVGKPFKAPQLQAVIDRWAAHRAAAPSQRQDQSVGA